MPIEENISLLSFEVNYNSQISNYVFSSKFKDIIQSMLQNTSYKIINWNTNNDFIYAFIKDDYTNRLMYLFLANINIDKFAWRDHILLRTASEIGHYNGKPYFYTKLKNLVESLDNLNVIYNYSGSFGS